jgi:hypothetical protein
MFSTMVSCVLMSTVGGHASAELAFQILHPLPGAAHPDGAAQLIGFGPVKSATVIAMRSKLLLEEWNAKVRFSTG